ncbi:MAG: hypothetical protein FWD27_01230 [Coriobacteriia bacterium]|nr:hypothetical protein [Coriobacteriia bacterium]
MAMKLLWNDFWLYAQTKAILGWRASTGVFAGFISSEIREEKELSSRLYQLYVIAFLATVIVLLWLALLHHVKIAFAALAALELGLAQELYGFMPMLPLALFVFSTLVSTWTSPWKLSEPDIAYIAASPLSVRSIVYWKVLSQMLLLGVTGAILGYLMGSGFQSVLDTAVSSGVFAAIAALSFVGTVLWSWVIGLSRLALAQKMKWWYIGGVSLCLLLLVVLVFFFTGATLSSWSQLALPLLVAVLALLCLMGLPLLTLVAKRVDVIRVVSESALYAETHNLRLASLYLLEGAGEFRRKRRIARRGLWVSAPLALGSFAVVSRSFLSHLRQFEGIPSIIIWGGAVPPLATMGVLLTFHLPIIWLIWIMVILLLPRGLREITRSYRDDRANSLIRNHLPFDNLNLLVLNALPGFLLSTLVSVVVVLLSLGLTDSLLPLSLILLAMLFCLVVNALLVLCSGVDNLPLLKTQQTASYEVTVLIFIAGFLLFSAFKLPLLALGFSLAYLLALLFVVKKS